LDYFFRDILITLTPSMVFFVLENNPDAAKPKDSPVIKPLPLSLGYRIKRPTSIPSKAATRAESFFGKPRLFSSSTTPTIRGIIGT